MDFNDSELDERKDVEALRGLALRHTDFSLSGKDPFGRVGEKGAGTVLCTKGL